MSQPNKNVYLREVAEPWQAFWFNHGAVCRSLSELANTLAEINDEQFIYHVNAEHNDLAKWIDEVIGDADLAARLARVAGRNEAEAVVRIRIADLATPSKDDDRHDEPPTASGKSSRTRPATVRASAKKTIKKAAPAKTAAGAKTKAGGRRSTKAKPQATNKATTESAGSPALSAVADETPVQTSSSNPFWRRLFGQ